MLAMEAENRPHSREAQRTMWTLIVPLVMGPMQTEYRAEFETQQQCLAARQVLIDRALEPWSFIRAGLSASENAAIAAEEQARADQPPGYDAGWHYLNDGAGYCSNAASLPSTRGRN